ncbi:BTAD domain-containing putative transcriptional regulator [Actinocorallia sp. A-T 12471]|uniref:BTAD domain-containing putative transcriptional regulator n=1 Tax=Actinocorallia sp. A-T 12471 TaxID=3089813 RepID=UPI0029D0A351|nr:BTAD domain-containing putative transcriptional regulator [Actinocorallia sp. A-T 12471]MDX6744023.1 BTAD domain-containing putative transcriptional regulator [Actinocorallia sp. A-T 12471]
MAFLGGSVGLRRGLRVLVGIGVLGPMTASVDGRRVALGGLRQRAVLAVLVAAGGRAVSEERLLADVWGDGDPPGSGTLKSYVSVLRRILEPGRASGEAARLIVREGNGYLLRPGSAEVDAETFAARATEGADLLAAGEAAKAVPVLREALALWRGEPYAEFGDLPFAAPERARLEGLRLTATEHLYEARLALGGHGALIGDLDKHTLENPLSERGWELLATALYRAGRQGDALAALRRARAVLAEELGIDPGPALRRLEAAILAQEEQVGAEPAAPATPRGRNLPHALSRFVGRAGEPAKVEALLAEHRLVTLTGPGGIGKTRLALETARARPDADGPWLVELAELEDPTLLAATLAGVLGITGATTPERLGDVLGDRELLLVLDNCEHLVAEVRAAVGALLTRAGGLRVLATSRETLNLPGEAVYEVRPLPADEGRELFVARAAAALPGWEPSAEEDLHLRALCRELDGLPLAIELAAAQCRVLSVRQIAEALDDRFAVLRDGPGPNRHRTLRATVEWSYDRLTPAEQKVLHRLGVFASAFDLDAAAAICGRQVLPELSALVRKSLVTVEAGTAPRRYRLLETIREFTGGRLDPDVQAAHRAWVLGEAEAAAPQLRGHRSAAVVRRLHAQQPEHRFALTSALLVGDGDYALRLSGQLSWFWYAQGIVAEGLGWIKSAIQLSPSAGPDLRAPTLLAEARLSYLAGDFPNARRAADDAIRAGHALDDPEVIAEAMLHRALFDALCGATDFLDLARAGLEQARELRADWLVAEGLMIVGMLLRFAGLITEARAHLAESVEVAGKTGYVFIHCSSLWLLAKIDLDLGSPELALTSGWDMLLRLDENGDVTSWVVAVHTLAAALTMAGRPADGATLLGAADHHGSRVGFSPVEMDPLDAPRQAAMVREGLPAEEFQASYNRGRSLTRTEIRALAESWRATRTA